MTLGCLAILNGGAWGEGFDYPPIPGSESHSLDLVVTPQGNPVVAWNNNNLDDNSTNSFTLLVRQWDGAKWRLVGDSGLGGPIIKKEGKIFPKTIISYENPLQALAVNPRGYPFVVWVREGALRLHTCNGSQWTEFAGLRDHAATSRTQVQSRYPNLALDSQSNPVVVWNETALGQIYVRHWKKNSWVDLGDSADDGGLAYQSDFLCRPSITVDHQDRPVAVWSGKIVPPFRGSWDGIFLKRWNQGRWEGLGGSELARGLSDISGLIHGTAVVTDFSDRPIVAWLVAPDTGNGFGDECIFLKQWDGKQWIELGGSASGTGIRTLKKGQMNNLGLALDSKMRPIVSCADDEGSRIYLNRWDGAKWVEFVPSGLGASAERAFCFPVIRTDKQGNLFIAWVDRTEEDAVKVRVKKINLQD